MLGVLSPAMVSVSLSLSRGRSAKRFDPLQLFFLGFRDVRGLWSLLSLDHFELYLVTFG